MKAAVARLKTAKLPTLQVDGSSVKESLRDCVRDALARYFATLDGHDCRDLFDLVIGEVEIPLLEIVLEHADGNQTKAAKMLGINRGTLRKKLQQYDLS